MHQPLQVLGETAIEDQGSSCKRRPVCAASTFNLGSFYYCRVCSFFAFEDFKLSEFSWRCLDNRMFLGSFSIACCPFQVERVGSGTPCGQDRNCKNVLTAYNLLSRQSKVLPVPNYMFGVYIGTKDTPVWIEEMFKEQGKGRELHLYLVRSKLLEKQDWSE